MASPKRILMASHIAEPKGSAMSFFTLISGLDRKKFFPIPVFASDGPLRSELDKQGVRSIVLPYRGLHKISARFRIKSILRKEKIDLIYANCAVGFSRVIAVAGKKLGIPVIWHIREPPLGSRVIKNKPWIKKTASKVIAVSKELEEHFGAGTSVIKVDNGVDLSRFNNDLDKQLYRNEYQLDSSHFVYGMVGSIEPRKNSEMFIRASADIAKKHSHARFIITGSGDDLYVKEMKALASKLGLNNKMFFTGSLWDTPQLMSSLDILVMPSVWEGFPRVVVESMAVGTPVIASDVGDVSYILDAGLSGIIMQELSAQQLLKEMQKAISNPEDLEAIAARALQKCHQQFSQAQHVKKMQAIFSEVLDNTSAMQS